MRRILALALLAPALALAQLPPAVRDALARAGVPESAVESRYYSELLIAAGLVAKP